MDRVCRDSNDIIKLMLCDECTDLWTGKLEIVKRGQEGKDARDTMQNIWKEFLLSTTNWKAEFIWGTNNVLHPTQTVLWGKGMCKTSHRKYSVYEGKLLLQLWSSNVTCLLVSPMLLLKYRQGRTVSLHPFPSPFIKTSLQKQVKLKQKKSYTKIEPKNL